MTTRYKKERYEGNDKRSAVTTALAASIPSITVSALGLFAATFGVALYSDIDIIGSMCSLMARGAIISMLCVILILPALFLLLDKVICATSIGLKPKTERKIYGGLMIMKKKYSMKILSFLLSCAVLCGSAGILVSAGTGEEREAERLSAAAAGSEAEDQPLHKSETVYVLTNADGSVRNIIVSDWIKNAPWPERLSRIKRNCRIFVI